MCSPGTEDGQGRGNSAGLKGRGEEMHPSEEGKQSLQWVLPTEGNFLGKDRALETMWFIQKRVSPSAPTIMDAIEQED